MISVDGEITMKNLAISMKLALIGSTTIDSSKYELPVNSNITVNVMEGSKITVTQNLALLPGTQMYIAEGANVTLGDNYEIYIYAKDQWGNYNYPGTAVNPLKFAPGKPDSVSWHTAAADAYIYVEGTLDASGGYVYTTASGANITAKDGAKVILKAGDKSSTYQATQSGSDITYVQIPITPAKLKNANENYPAYTETAAYTDVTTFTYSDEV